MKAGADATPVLAAQGRVPTVRSQRELRRAIGGWVRVTADSATSAYVSKVCDDIVDYARVGASGHGDLRRDVLEVATVFWACFVEARPPGAQEVATLGALGAKQAELGISLEGLSTAVQLGRGDVVRLVERCPLVTMRASATDAVAAVRRAVEHFDVVVAAILAGYRREQAAKRTDAKRRMVDALLGDGPPDPALPSHAKRLGVDLTVPFAVLVLAPYDQGEDDLVSVDRAVAAIVALRPEAIDAREQAASGVRGTVLLPTRSPSTWLGALGPLDRVARENNVVMVAGGPARGVGDIARTYQEARSLVDLARCAAEGACVLRVEDLAVYRLVSAWSHDVERWMTSGPVGRLLALPEGKRARLAEAMWALFVTDESYVAAADVLGITPKAVRNRVETLSRLTGLLPRSSQDRLLLWLALHRMRLTSTARAWRPVLGSATAEIFPSEA